jgi:hypothetical protein
MTPRLASGVGGDLPQTRFAIWMRNRSMRMTTRWPMRALIAKDAQGRRDHARGLPRLTGRRRVRDEAEPRPEPALGLR